MSRGIEYFVVIEASIEASIIFLQHFHTQLRSLEFYRGFKVDELEAFAFAVLLKFAEIGVPEQGQIDIVGLKTESARMDVFSLDRGEIVVRFPAFHHRVRLLPSHHRVDLTFHQHPPLHTWMYLCLLQRRL